MTTDTATNPVGEDAARVDPTGVAPEGADASTDDIDTEDFDRMPAPADDEEVAESAEKAEGDKTFKDAEGKPADDEVIEYDLGDGTKVKAPKALEPHLLRQADYTRKTQEVAEERRKHTEAVSNWQAEQAQQAESLETFRAEHTRVSVLQSTIAQLTEHRDYYNQVDWDGLRQQDPARYDKLREQQRFVRDTLTDKQEELTGAKKDLEGKEAKRLDERKQAAEQAAAKAREETGAALAKAGFTQERVTEVAKFAVTELGIPAEDLADADATAWKVVDRLMKAEARAKAAEDKLTKATAVQSNTKAQTSQPADKVRGSGAQTRDPSTPRGDGLSTDEWMRRRTAQRVKR